MDKSVENESQASNGMEVVPTNAAPPARTRKKLSPEERLRKKKLELVKKLEAAGIPALRIEHFETIADIGTYLGQKGFDKLSGGETATAIYEATKMFDETTERIKTEEDDDRKIKLMELKERLLERRIAGAERLAKLADKLPPPGQPSPNHAFPPNVAVQFNVTAKDAEIKTSSENTRQTPNDNDE